ncbi:GntR family transcriptional regulator [Paenibacillus sp. CF384]|uniref:GntR family transcriptional regulator n=1 Tax=Paenibacillus sp. CF384 TaxID=1884382 RepID=UPI000894DB4A|nr:GntR family transcriptional regulator [Paenibacillus sp. CF384]SDX55842.1 transcriptional regulator, GntR family [Paenibacillus sp. CF384]
MMANSTLIDTAYDYVNTQIRTGEFMPGSLLSENELSETLNMSRTPIRAAISRLEHEGLLVTLKNRGVLVKEISMKEVIDTMEVLYLFQLQAIALLKDGVVEPDLKNLQEHLNRSILAEQNNDYTQYLVSSMKFSECLLNVMNNGVIAKIVDASVKQMILFATINFKLTPHEPHYSANRLNQSIYDTILAGDYDRFREIANQSYAHNRQRMLRMSRL